MTELSSAAQAVLFAWDDVVGRRGDPTPTEQRALAAALKALADQVVPENPCGDDCCITQCEQIRAELLAIAAELEQLPTGDS